MQFCLQELLYLFLQRGDWPMHKMECVAMCAYGENWCPSETVRLVARIILKQVKMESFFVPFRNSFIVVQGSYRSH